MKRHSRDQSLRRADGRIVSHQCLLRVDRNFHGTWIPHHVMDVVYALIDCENFYVSCERVFDPSLREVPVAVLSNNDGCIIARSEKLKAEGIPMGAPYFKWREEIEEMNGVVLSSNYTLYGDMSRRVHALIEEEALALERYSIDEAFATLPGLERQNLQRLADSIRRKILRQVGVPVRVGIGPTKTLAKVADENAKARKRAGWGQGTYVCPTGEKQEEPHAHRVQQITRMQVRLEKTSEDGRLLGPDGNPEGHMRLSRRELESGGSALHTPTRTRFYRDKEEARDREKARGG